LGSLEGHTTWINSINFSPDNKRVITASWDGSARLWDVYPGTQQMLLEGQQRVERTLTDFECQLYLYMQYCPPLQ
jgi:WD40 repeat protein